LLYGPPASAKTSLFKALYEKNGWERVVVIDGHAMTKAGLEEWLREKAKDETLPDILVIEEVEKQDPKNLRCLLSVMASGYLCKLNAKIGREEAQTPLLVWATCNDEDVPAGGFSHGRPIQTMRHV
jgi:hypothetical protein